MKPFLLASVLMFAATPGLALAGGHWDGRGGGHYRYDGGHGRWGGGYYRHDHWDSGVRIGIGFGIGVADYDYCDGPVYSSAGYCAPTVVYSSPPVVYAQPQVVYTTPAPVVVTPAPTYAAPPVVYVPAQAGGYYYTSGVVTVYGR